MLKSASDEEMLVLLLRKVIAVFGLYSREALGENKISNKETVMQKAILSGHCEPSLLLTLDIGCMPCNPVAQPEIPKCNIPAVNSYT